MLFTRKAPKIEDTPVTVLDRPLQAKPVEAGSEEYFKEYTELANRVKAYVPDLIDERFKRFLNQHDIPVFNLQEVIKYMDAKAKKEVKNGWSWHPYRQKDRTDRVFGSHTPVYSDWYTSWVYDKPIPLHALKKVALIEQHFGDQIKLFVSDYAVVNPDPFLMALVVYSSERLRLGEGRYVIDVWDEPGFGLEQMLK
jgi:hypothetical protein